MKFLLSLFAIFIITESCNSPKQAFADTKEPVIQSKSSDNKDTMIKKSNQVGEHYNTSGVTYTATSRGSYAYINISESKVTFTEDRNQKDMANYTCDKSDWEALKKLMDAVDLLTLNKLKAPTGKRLYDGAAHATLSIRQGDMIVMSPSFDHGHPPEEIEELVNKVLSIKESVVKQ